MQLQATATPEVPGPTSSKNTPGEARERHSRIVRSPAGAQAHLRAGEAPGATLAVPPWPVPHSPAAPAGRGPGPETLANWLGPCMDTFGADVP